MGDLLGVLLSAVDMSVTSLLFLAGVTITPYSLSNDSYSEDSWCLFF